MTLDEYIGMFMESRMPLSTDRVIGYLHDIRDEHPFMPNCGVFNRKEANHRLYIRSACSIVEKELIKALPWSDYREVLARLEWPYMRRVANHSMNDIYNGPDGEKWGEADAWFLEMWLAYHEIFLSMPGFELNTIQWKMYDNMLKQVCKKLAKYRRRL